MKIGKETIPGLTQKPTAGGLRYYWEPSPKLRKANWKTLTLSSDLPRAIDEAKEQNAKVAQWQSGGARPRQVAKFIKQGTFADIIASYRASKHLTLRRTTQRVDETALKLLGEWAGEQPLAWITRERVKVLRNNLCPRAGTIRPDERNVPGHAKAFHTLTTGRKVISWWIREKDLDVKNPFQEFGLSAPPPRDEIWDRDCTQAITAAAIRAGKPSLGFALEVGEYLGQREEDIITLTDRQWKEITLQELQFDEGLYQALKSDHGPNAGQVMGFKVRQSKTKRWIGAPIEGDLRDRVEAAFAARRAAAPDSIAPLPLFINESTGKPWVQSTFIHEFADARADAIAKAIEAGDDDLAQRLQLLQFRDLRRTCVVRLGEIGMDDQGISAITGHKLGTIKKILEVYMPRTTVMAARAIVARIGPRPATPGKEPSEQQA